MTSVFFNSDFRFLFTARMDPQILIFKKICPVTEMFQFFNCDNKFVHKKKQKSRKSTIQVV